MMTNPNDSGWKKSIQINIFDEDLASLGRKRIDLQQILKNNKIEHFSVTEVPIFVGSQVSTNGKSSEAEDTGVRIKKAATATPRLTSVRKISTQNIDVGLKPFARVTSDPSAYESYNFGELNEIRNEESTTVVEQLQEIMKSLTSKAGMSSVKTEEPEPDENEETRVTLKTEVESEADAAAAGNSGGVAATAAADESTLGTSSMKEEPIENDASSFMKLLFDQGLLNIDQMQLGKWCGDEEEASPAKRRKASGDDGDQPQLIKCQFPNCNHMHSWKVKYGKLRLLDHALTHCEAAILPCHLCGFLAKNVRQMRSHYSKDHPNERATGYGMKNMPIDEQQMQELWTKCYEKVIPIVGLATSSNGIDKAKRIHRKKEIESGE